MIGFLIKVKTFLFEFSQSIATLSKVLIQSRYQTALKKESTRDKCIIIGNGPSFKTSLTKFKQVLVKNDCLCVNSFVSTDEFEEIKPKYYVLCAPFFFYSDEVLSPYYKNLKHNTFAAIENKVKWDFHLVVPMFAKKSKEFKSVIKNNKHITPYYVNLTPIEGLSSINHFFFKRKMGLPRPHNVLIPSIMQMIHTGYKEIYIIGADHSWLSEISVNEQNEAMVNQKHFYDENESRPQKMMDRASGPRKLHEILDKFQLSFKGYWEIKAYAAKLGIKIYNSSEVSMIDAFERKKLS